MAPPHDTSKSLVLLRWPETRVMLDFGFLKCLAKSSMTRSLAFPSTGGTLTRTARVWGPVISTLSFLERALTRTEILIREGYLISGVAVVIARAKNAHVALAGSTLTVGWLFFAEVTHVHERRVS